MTQDRAVFYVSAVGRDDWSGLLPDPAPDRSDGPFAGVARAQKAVRQIDKSGPGTVGIVLRGGTYEPDRPIRLEGADSGSASCPVSYEAWPGERPVISAGVRVTGWEESVRNGRRSWVAPAPGHVFHNL